MEGSPVDDVNFVQEKSCVYFRCELAVPQAYAQTGIQDNNSHQNNNHWKPKNILVRLSEDKNPWVTDL